MSSRVAVLVLGAHRSGTSAMARVVNLLGVDLGSDILPPKFDNRHGYWENRAIFDLHERLLSKAGSAWHDYRTMPSGWRDREEVEAIRGELIAILGREFGGARLWGVKDPRLGRLLPFWLALLEELGVEPRFLILVRNPLEVVDSLERRNEFSRSKSLLLCLADMIVAARDSAGYRRSFVTYADLLADWRSVVARVERELALEWPRPVGEAAGEIDEYLKPGERHHHRPIEDLHGDPMVPAWASALYGALNEASQGDTSAVTGAVERASRGLDSMLDLFVPEIDELTERLARAEVELAGARAEAAGARAELTQIRSSRLFRMRATMGRAWARLAPGRTG